MDRNYEQVFGLTLGPEGQCRGTTPEQVGKETKCTSIGEAAAESPGSLVCLWGRTTPPSPSRGSKGPAWRWPPQPSAMRRHRVVGLLLCASGALFARLGL